MHGRWGNPNLSKRTRKVVWCGPTARNVHRFATAAFQQCKCMERIVNTFFAQNGKEQIPKTIFLSPFVRIFTVVGLPFSEISANGSSTLHSHPLDDVTIIFVVFHGNVKCFAVFSVPWKRYDFTSFQMVIYHDAMRGHMDFLYIVSNFPNTLPVFLLGPTCI